MLLIREIFYCKPGKVRPMIINLGNEPHGTGERVRANVAAYRAVYEEVKKVDPTYFDKQPLTYPASPAPAEHNEVAEK